MASTALTFKQIQDLTQDQLQEVLGATDMTVTKIKLYINLGYKDFARRTKSLLGSLDITTVADDAEYSIINARFFHISHVRYVVDATEYGRALKPYPGGFANLPRAKASGEPCFYWVRFAGDNTAHELGTIPVTGTASETIRVWGSTLPTDLSANGDIPVIHEGYHEALVLYPVWKICNAYAHKSRAIREKANVARSEYLEFVEGAKGDASTMTTEEIATIDEYSIYDGVSYF